MHVDDIFTKAHAAGKIPVSFEMFPPKGELTLDKARDAAKKLSAYGPDFISVTCSAGEAAISPRPPPSPRCSRASSTSALWRTLPAFRSRGKGSRSASPSGKGRWWRTCSPFAAIGPRKTSPLYGASDFSFAAQIIPALIEAGFCVGGAAYPEGHIECESLETSVEHLKLKQDAGASFFVTQLFDKRPLLDFWTLPKRPASRCPSPAESCPL